MAERQRHRARTRVWAVAAGALTIAVGAPAAGAASPTGTTPLPAPTNLTVMGDLSCSGGTWVTNSTPTLEAVGTAPNGGNVGLLFRVDRNPAVRYNTTPVSALSGSPGQWSVTDGPDTAPLPDGRYHFQARTVVQTPTGTEMSPWSAPYDFGVRTVAPGAPAVTSFDYPVAAWGAPANHPGVFTLTGSPNTFVFEYSVDSQILPSPTGCQVQARYGMVRAHKGVAQFRPIGLGVGPHTLYVGAFSRARNFGGISAGYRFYVSPSFPGEGNTRPEAEALSWTAGDPSNDCAFVQSGPSEWSGGAQERLMADSPSSPGSPESSFTTTFQARVPGNYSLGAEVTTGPDYGTLTFALDGAPIEIVGQPVTYTATSATPGTHFIFLGGAPLTRGAHKLTVYIGGPAGSPTTTAACGQSAYNDQGYSAGVDYLIAVPINDVTYPSFVAALDNHGVASDGTEPADFGPCRCHDALSLQALTSAGFGPGQTVTVGGVTYTMPEYKGTGHDQRDNVVAGGQTIGLPYGQTPVDNIDLLVAATCVPGPSYVIPIYPANGFELEFGSRYIYAFGAAVPDWINGNPSSATSSTGATISLAATLSHIDTGPGATPDQSKPATIYQVTIPTLYSSGYTSGEVTGITLPNIGSNFGPGCTTATLHVLAISAS